jgi:hypothetical protein
MKEPAMRTRTILLSVAALALIGVTTTACVSPQGQLIARNLTGQGFPGPVSAPLAPTAASQAADLSGSSVGFAAGSGAGLQRLVPSVITRDVVEEGWLKMAGRPVLGGWYSDRSGPMAYTIVTGDFLAETRVRAVKAGAPTGRPTGAFNSAGLLVRDPASGPGTMRWAMFNIGMQEEFYGTEIKMTVPDFGGRNPHGLAGMKSRSTLWLTPVPDGIIEAELRLCRVGGELRFFHRLAGATGWTELQRTPQTTVQGNGSARPTAGVPDASGPMRFTRTGLPDTVQIGLIVNPGMPPSDGEGWFDGLRLTRITSADQCGRDL